MGQKKKKVLYIHGQLFPHNQSIFTIALITPLDGFSQFGNAAFSSSKQSVCVIKSETRIRP